MLNKTTYLLTYLLKQAPVDKRTFKNITFALRQHSIAISQWIVNGPL